MKNDIVPSAAPPKPDPVVKFISPPLETPARALPDVITTDPPLPEMVPPSPAFKRIPPPFKEPEPEVLSKVNRELPPKLPPSLNCTWVSEPPGVPLPPDDKHVPEGIRKHPAASWMPLAKVEVPEVMLSAVA